MTHLLLHAAGHLKSSGFGIRQLCDLTLWIEQKELNYDYLKRRLHELGIEIFSAYTLEACQTLFQLVSPVDFNPIHLDKDILEQFIQTVFHNGVHGHREKDHQFGNYFAYGEHKEKSWRIFLQCLFPSIRDLSRRYTYAHLYPILLPLAWVHRFFRVIFDPVFSPKQKLVFLTKTPQVAKQKAVLLKALMLSS